MSVATKEKCLVRVTSRRRTGRLFFASSPIRIYRNGQQLTIPIAEAQPGDMGPTLKTFEYGCQELHPITGIEKVSYASL